MWERRRRWGMGGGTRPDRAEAGSEQKIPALVHSCSLFGRTLPGGGFYLHKLFTQTFEEGRDNSKVKTHISLLKIIT